MSGAECKPLGFGYVATYSATLSFPVEVVALDSTHIGLFVTRDEGTYGMIMWGSGA